MIFDHFAKKPVGVKIFLSAGKNDSSAASAINVSQS
jgi:hypothetical protein